MGSRARSSRTTPPGRWHGAKECENTLVNGQRRQGASTHLQGALGGWAAVATLADDRRAGRFMDVLTARGTARGRRRVRASATRSCSGIAKRWNRLAVKTSKEHDSTAAAGASTGRTAAPLLVVDGRSREHRGRALAGQSGLGTSGVVAGPGGPKYMRGSLTCRGSDLGEPRLLVARVLQQPRVGGWIRFW